MMNRRIMQAAYTVKRELYYEHLTIDDVGLTVCNMNKCVKRDQCA